MSALRERSNITGCVGVATIVTRVPEATRMHQSSFCHSHAAAGTTQAFEMPRTFILLEAMTVHSVATLGTGVRTCDT
jgi:hypothetical protein